MLDYFRMAHETRKPELKSVPLTELMKSAALEAGWHLEHIDNLQNKNKDAVRYDKPFSSIVTAELSCRLQKSIMKLLQKKDTSSSPIDSYIGWGIFNFIKSYKPDVHNTDEKILAAAYNSVKCKVDQLLRKEIFRHRPHHKALVLQTEGYDSLKIEIESSGGTEEEAENIKKYTYVNSPKEVSIHTPSGGKDGEDSKELGDTLSSGTSPLDEVVYQDEVEDLVEKYSEDEVQGQIIRILIEAGNSGRVRPGDIREEAKGEVIQDGEGNKTYKHSIPGSEIIRQSVIREIKISMNLAEDAEVEISEELIEKKMARKIKVFYRQLKKRLAAEHSTEDDEDED